MGMRLTKAYYIDRGYQDATAGKPPAMLIPDYGHKTTRGRTWAAMAYHEGWRSGHDERAGCLSFPLAPARFPEGTLVRSYDFPGVRDCYVEGIVGGYEEREGCLRYRIMATRRVFRGEELAGTGDMFLPPVNGTPSWLGGHVCGVEKVNIEEYMAS